MPASILYSIIIGEFAAGFVLCYALFYYDVISMTNLTERKENEPTC